MGDETRKGALLPSTSTGTFGRSRAVRRVSRLSKSGSQRCASDSKSDRRIWETQLADLKTELASQPVETVKDLLRLGEKVLADTVLDVGAGSRGVAGDATASKLATRLARALDSLSRSTTGAEIRPADAHQLADLQIFVRDTVRTVRSVRRLLRGTARRATSRRTTILRAQGAYYLLSGLWAMVDRRDRDGDRAEDGLLACPNGRSLGDGNRSEPANRSSRRSAVT